MVAWPSAFWKFFYWATPFLILFSKKVLISSSVIVALMSLTKITLGATRCLVVAGTACLGGSIGSVGGTTCLGG